MNSGDRSDMNVHTHTMHLSMLLYALNVSTIVNTFHQLIGDLDTLELGLKLFEFPATIIDDCN